MYQAQARELAAGDDPIVGDEEIRWAIAHGSPVVREVVRRMAAFWALVAVGWARSFASSTRAFAADQRQRAATRVDMSHRSDDDHAHPLQTGGPHARHTHYGQPSSG